MKKLFALLAVIGILSFGVSKILNAQDPEESTEETTEEVAESTEVEAPEAAPEESTESEEPKEEKTKLHQVIKQKFIDGGPGFMATILFSLIFGLALAIERIIYLNLATTNSDKLLQNIEDALESGGVEAAKEVCRNTRGPVASIFYQGLDRMDHGLDIVEKSIVSYGSVQMGLLEKNLSWISLFIAIAPMLGFMGTVIGMIAAFKTIQEMGDIQAGAVAGPIGIALITTASGLIVAIILQIFYNYIISKIDGIVNDMENSSISLMDILIKHNLKK